MLHLCLSGNCQLLCMGRKQLYRPGHQIQVTAISESGIAYFSELRYGGEGEFYYTVDDSGTVYIDGVKYFSYFESLPYSG